MSVIPMSNYLWMLLRTITCVLEIVWHKILNIIIGAKKNKLPPIEEPILIESACSLAAKIRKQEISSKEVVAAFIKRIREVNPLLNAVIDERFKDAMEDAQAADEYIRNSGKNESELADEKPFLGIPITSKNAIGIKGLILNSGVALKKYDVAKVDSDAVDLMRKAGAIPLCISNVPEYCMWIDSSNTLYGKTNNPYDLTRICGGSSGGEGALVGSAASPIGIGNDLGGSIRVPAYYGGVFGHKPTRKVVSNKGQFPSSYRTGLDEINVTGPICKRADDLLPVMKILTENNPILKLDENVNLEDIRIYYTDRYPKDIGVMSQQRETKNRLKEVVSYLEKVTGNKAKKVASTELSSGIVPLVMTKYMKAKAPSMVEIITGKEEYKFNLSWEFLKWIIGYCKHSLGCLVFLLYAKFYLSQSEEFYKKIDQKYEKLDQELKVILGENGVLIYPNFPGSAYYHQEHILKIGSISFTAPFSVLGYPVSQCPVGLGKEGFPLGVQVVGYRHNDRLTMAVARTIEKGFGGWKSPSKIL